MAQDVSIDLVFQAVDNVTRTVEKVNNSIKEINNNKFDKITSGITALSTGFLAIQKAASLVFEGVRSFGNVLRESVDLAADAEKTNILLANALSNVAGGSQEAFESLQSYATQLQSTTGIEDESIKNAQRLLIQYGVQVDKVNELTAGIADYSAAVGVDLSTAASQAARVLENGATSIGRYKLGLSETSTELERTTALMRFFGQFSGTAEAAANSFSGRMNILKATVNEAKESLGSLITNNTFVIEGLKLVSDAFIKLQKYIEKNKASIMEFIKEGIVELVKGFAFILKASDPIYKFFVGLYNVWNLLKLALNSVIENILRTATVFVKLGEVMGVKNELGESIKSLYKASSEVGDEIVQSMEKAIGTTETYSDFVKKAEGYVTGLGDKLQKLPSTKEIKVKVIGDKGKSLVDAIKFDFNAVLKDIDISAGGAKKMVNSLADALGAPFGPVGKAVAEVFKFLAVDSETFKKNLDGFLDFLINLPKYIAQNIPYLIEKIIESIPELIAALEDAIPMLIDNISNMLSDPAFWDKVINAMISTMVIQLGNPMFHMAIAQAIARAYIESAPKIAQAMVDSIKAKIGEAFSSFGTSIDRFNSAIDKFIQAVNSVGSAGSKAGNFFSDVGKSAGGFVGKVGKKLGFADGGEVPIIAHGGETVIDRSTTESLKQFLSGQSNRNMTVNIVVGEKELASVLVDLNAKGFRVA